MQFYMIESAAVAGKQQSFLFQCSCSCTYSSASGVSTIIVLSYKWHTERMPWMHKLWCSLPATENRRFPLYRKINTRSHRGNQFSKKYYNWQHTLKHLTLYIGDSENKKSDRTVNVARIT